jgi:hypothetical protein
MKTLITIGTAAALAAFSSGGVYAQPAQAPGGAPTENGAGFGPQELTTFKVRDNFYMIRNAQSGNCSVLVADDGVVLIDNKFEMDHDSIMTKLREITDKPVLYVINTHLHADHSGGNATKQALGAKVIAHENARFQMAKTQAMGLPNLTLEDHMRLYHGEFVIDLYWLGRGRVCMCEPRTGRSLSPVTVHFDYRFPHLYPRSLLNWVMRAAIAVVLYSRCGTQRF